jgi:hypothetical protein
VRVIGGHAGADAAERSANLRVAPACRLMGLQT